MMRWLRAVVAVAAVLVILALGSVIGLLTVANSSFVAVKPHPWLAPVLEPMIGGQVVEIQLPVLLAGWVLAVFAVAGLIAGTVLQAWRRRQYESLIARLEQELVRLRNLPITAPAPLEDLPEHPDAEAARALEDALGQGMGLARGPDLTDLTNLTDPRGLTGLTGLAGASPAAATLGPATARGGRP